MKDIILVMGLFGCIKDTKRHILFSNIFQFFFLVEEKIFIHPKLPNRETKYQILPRKKRRGEITNDG
jgi:hypothetical protein